MTLKSISPSQLELGMYVQAFKGSWFSHPFWRARFLLEDEERLHALRTSGLDAVVIDTARGRDLPVQEQPLAETPQDMLLRRIRTAREAARSAPLPATASGSAPPVPAIPSSTTRGLRSGPVPMAREFGNARLVAGKAGKVISRVFLEARHGKAPRLADVGPVVEDIHGSIQRNPYAFSSLMRCKAESETAYHHMLSTSALMVSLARQMRLQPRETRLAGMAGLLLDVGLATMDLDVDGLAGRFDTVDREFLGRHCDIGRDLLAAASDMPPEVIHAVTRHHERLDGSGFPHGLAGSDIDVYSRMAAVCDTYDHLVSGAATGRPLDPADAMRALQDMEGALDGMILARFREAMGIYPIGAFVLLRSRRIAMVVDQDPADPALPTVRTVYSLATGKNVRPQTIALAQCFGADGIEGCADLTGLPLPAPEELRERLLIKAAD